MTQNNDRSKVRDEERQVSQADTNDQTNPGEDSMRTEENNAIERTEPNKTPDRKGETQKVKDDEGKDNDEDVD